jgi:phosphoadenosine phosphosulfate reductase
MAYLSSASDIEKLPAEAIIERALGEQEGAACITCSFQAGGMVVLDLLRKRAPKIPVLFVDTGYHFAETYAFRDRIARLWDLNLVNVTPKQTVPEQESKFGILNQTDPDRCCRLRKVEPLHAGLQPFDIWFTGLRREQSSTRRDLRAIENHRLPNGKTLVKVNPIVGWTEKQVWVYTLENRIEYLPLYNEGYTSIGCQPCTTIPLPGADARSGRWGGKKTECGIHTFAKEEERCRC